MSSLLRKFCSALVVILGVLVSPGILQAEENHGLFTNILQKYVKEGLVDYKNLCQDQRLNQYLVQLSNTDVNNLSLEDAKAFWINAYNGFTLELICKNYPIQSINQLHAGGLILGSVIKKTAWDKPFISILGKKYTLGQIEHEILRPVYKDARIHFAIVCAAKSCPPLRSESFEGFKLNDQLNDQGRTFLVNRQDLNSFDIKTRTANVSSIFKWFLKDFGKNPKDLLIYLSDYLPNEVQNDIKVNPSLWKIKFREYDWSLNEL